jgi:predicted GIY-YIG superfamily endonuclease
MLTTHPDSILFTWRGATVLLTPPPPLAYVYLIHFSRPIGLNVKKNGVKHYASHYIGSTVCLDYRMAQHRANDGAALLRHCNEIGVAWWIERLWVFQSSEAARAFEKKLKHASHGPRYCPRCNTRLRPDPLVMLRRGHHPAVSRPVGKRRSMHLPVLHFVRRVRNEARSC